MPDVSARASTTLNEICSSLFARRPENEIDIKLDRMYGVLSLLGDPQNTCKVVHIAGTNGKTSTSKYISQMLQALGYSVGRYTSPHLISVLERIEIEGEMVPEERFVAEYERIMPVIERYENEHSEHGKFGFFEIITIIAYALFAAKRLDFAIVEVGLGGSFDATNVSENVALSVITPIGVDHVEFLGSDIESIAREKAGIIKPGVPVIIAPQSANVQAVLDAKISETGTQAKVLEVDSTFGDTYLAQNFALAAKSVQMLVGDAIRSLDLHQMFEGALVPGRLQMVHRTPNVMVDASHNPHGAKALVEALRTLSFTHIVAVVAGFTDKDTKGFLEVLSGVVSEYVFTKNSSPRSHTPESIQAVYGSLRTSSPKPNDRVAEDIPSAIALAEKIVATKFGTSSDQALILITGSVVTAGDALHFFGNNLQPSSKPS
ncbi:MAG: bifunctional folylpolyglutamate synthase/dihydrofolate synthase [Candidatus Ancillula sp.]|jgi:dihydrofolate synthase/folylpolyglutamate synthase|nr:bifunctional folylpolyglutamate synthase/dihydrofolate synthase [Candidatus Ancillula sp.]